MDKKISKLNAQEYLEALEKLTPEELKEKYFPLIRGIASKYKGAKEKDGLKGLFQAVALFMFRKPDVRFDIYATWFIREEIEKGLPFLQRFCLIPYRASRWLNHLFWKQSQKKMGKA